MYGWVFDAPGNWQWEGDDRLIGPVNSGDISVTSVELPELKDIAKYEDRLREYAEGVRDNLPGDWWSGAELLEINWFERVELQGYVYYNLEYRVQENPDYCVLAVKELIGLAVALPGPAVGVRARGQGCEWRQLRLMGRILNTFRVVVRDASYYTQFINVNGIVVKASDDVVPEAMYRAAATVDAMMQGRRDLGECMRVSDAALAIIPEKEWVTTLPEFQWLSGEEVADGRPYDGFIIRGLGAVQGQPVSATSEENLLRRPQIHDPLHFLDITIHEFAHAIENLCFNPRDRQRLTALYQSVVDSGVIRGSYAATNEDEFFAIFTTVYFNATNELSPVAKDQDHLEEDFPDLYDFLWELYGTVPGDEFRR